MTREDRPAPLLDPVTAYARWAPSYPPHAHNPVMQAEQRALLSLLPANLGGHTVLDAGCGSGRYMLEALRRGATSIVGVDLSPQMLQRARAELQRSLSSQDLPGIALLQASLEALPLRERWADFTICGLTIGHLPTLAAGLGELRRVTRPDGVIVCSDFHPLAHARGWRREFTSNGQRYAVQHTAHGNEDWQRACAALGLRIVRTLEPCVDPQDVAGARLPDAAALSVPVALVLEMKAVG